MVAAVAGLAAAPAAQAALPESVGSAVHVSPAGSDEGTGASSAPLRSVARALSLAQPGQRVLLAGGTYTEPVVVGPQGTADAPITIEPAPGQRVVIAAGFKLNGARYVRVRGLVFDGTGSPGWGTSIWSSTGIEFSGNEITGYSSAQGILIKEQSADVRLLGNRIHDMGLSKSHDQGIYCESAAGVEIANNVIYRMQAGYGVHLFGDCDDARIVHNTIDGNYASGITLGGNADRGTTDRALVAGNVISGHRGTDDGQRGYAVTQYKAGTGNVVRDNLVWANDRGSDVNCPPCSVSGNVEGDPAFVDAAQGDFRLGPGSAALSRAPALGVEFDAAGTPRPQGAGPDMGAFERVESAGAPAPPAPAPAPAAPPPAAPRPAGGDRSPGSAPTASLWPRRPAFAWARVPGRWMSRSLR